MARQGTLKNAALLLVGFGLVALATVAVAQDEPPLDEDRFARVMATPDSLAFGSTAADSAREVPQILEVTGGMMGYVERSPIGETGAGELFVAGGQFMWWLLAVALLGFIFLIERLWTLNRARVNTRKLLGTVITTLRTEGVQAAAEECQKVRGPIAAILYSGLQKANKGPEAVEKAISTAGTIEMAFLERGLIWIASVTTIAPLIGFLGTVSGMINAFEAIAASDQVNAKLVASGISEALITTATGLVIAIPATIGYNYFVAAIDRFVIEMEETSAELVEELDRMRTGVGA
ncbi:MAG: MotA/TolQ/ExbB proton channel family protein [Candidatus Krumholzibacteriia bacterium]